MKVIGTKILHKTGGVCPAKCLAAIRRSDGFTECLPLSSHQPYGGGILKSSWDAGWSIDKIQNSLYRTKFITVPNIIEDWLSVHEGLAGKDVLEFGCGEGTVALAMKLRKNARLVIGIEILDVHEQCLPIARKEIGLESLPNNFHLRKIAPGENLAQWGQFDVVYSWSVFEHVAQNMIETALKSIFESLKPGGLFFLQVSPLFYSSNGSHMGPWVPAPWAHLTMQHNTFHQHLKDAPPTPAHVRSEWAVYIPIDSGKEVERTLLWETYQTLNRVTAPQLCSLTRGAGFKIVRDYRTCTEQKPPDELKEIYREDILTTEQIVLLLQRPHHQQGHR